MTLCLDIHTHHPVPQPEAVISLPVENFTPLEGQFYSVGVHPWLTAQPGFEPDWNLFSTLAARQEVVAIGECGIDKTRGGLMFKQINVLNRQIAESEKLKKPLILHDVKAHDIIVGLRRESNVTQNWAVHGFRGKPTVAKMLTDAGISLSFGEKFNPEALATVPLNMILAETDESPLSIEEIIENLSRAMNKDMKPVIIENTKRFLFNLK